MDLYVVLGVDSRASAPQIKRAYQKLARLLHPDLNPGDPVAERHFRSITLAYETLIDPERRRVYDTQGLSMTEDVASGIGFEGFDFSVSVVGDHASTFGDLFAEVLTPRSLLKAGERGENLLVPLALSFEEGMQGGSFRVTVTRRIACGSCGGGGATPSSHEACDRCGRAGRVRASRGHMVFSKQCPDCGGSGRKPPFVCRVCSGEGLTTRTETVSIAVPPGTQNQARLLVMGRGNVGRRGGPPGDLYVDVTTAPHRLFRRVGDDLVLEVPVGIHEAALGARVEVPTLEGVAPLRVPPGTQSGQRFRLRGRGAPSARHEQRGDLLVEIRIVLPEVIDERSKELLREFGRINTDDPRKLWAQPATRAAGAE